MRLSTRISDKSKNNGEIDSFIDWKKYTISSEDESEGLQLISDGDFIEIEIGKITIPFYSTKCNDCVNFESPLNLHCLIINKSTISIDCELQCTAYNKGHSKCRNCDHCVQAWFLVGADNIFARTPKVYIIKQNFKLSEHIKLPVEIEDRFKVWLEKAEIAYKERLGAGSVIYLRSVLEQITIKVGNDAGVDIYLSNGRSKPFNQILQAVDSQCSIIPIIYSDNGYNLFRRLSDIAHGNADEETALREYEPLRRLVIGILENIEKKEEEIKNNTEIRAALKAIGFSNEDEQNEQAE